MGVLPNTQNCGLRMRRERFPCHRLQRKPLVSDPSMHHGTCVTHVPRCMSGLLTKRSRHSRHMRNPQFCISGKRPTTGVLGSVRYILVSPTFVLIFYVISFITVGYSIAGKTFILSVFLFFCWARVCLDYCNNPIFIFLIISIVFVR